MRKAAAERRAGLGDKPYDPKYQSNPELTVPTR